MRAATPGFRGKTTMSERVRVRFAPSPTGYLHVGGLRTALYNYLFARRHGGQFILRIEDTDRTRYVPGAVEMIVDSLHWAGLDYDEGPGVGGPHEPYFQSERLAHYREAADRLVASGHAYPCFCTAARLDEMRKGREKQQQSTKYDRFCLRLTPEEIGAKKAAGDPFVLRLRIPEEKAVAVTDIVRGRVEISTEILDDQILLKSDGYPTYHLANVVDDHLMEITHVIRGEEWLPSTPKHVLLYRYLDWDAPRFAHLPLLLGTDRSKLSKRQADVAVSDYRGLGYYPEALVNFVALLGWNPGFDRDFFTLEDLVQEFSLERVGKSGAIFDLEKLRWLNGEYLRRKSPAELLAELAPLLAAKGIAGFDDAYLLRVLDLMRERITFVREVLEKSALVLRRSRGVRRGDRQEALDPREPRAPPAHAAGDRGSGAVRGRSARGGGQGVRRARRDQAVLARPPAEAGVHRHGRRPGPLRADGDARQGSLRAPDPQGPREPRLIGFSRPKEGRLLARAASTRDRNILASPKKGCLRTLLSRVEAADGRALPLRQLPCFFSMRAQVSLSVTVRLKTGAPGRESPCRRRSSRRARTGSGSPGRGGGERGSILQPAERLERLRVERGLPVGSLGHVAGVLLR